MSARPPTSSPQAWGSMGNRPQLIVIALPVLLLPSGREVGSTPLRGVCMRTIAVVNQKGGCGKTITSINLSAFLALAGRRVLMEDMDPQGHSTLGLPVGEGAPTRTMYDVFMGGTRGSETSIADVTRSVGENFDLAPADILLSAIPEALAGVASRENILARALADLE